MDAPFHPPVKRSIAIAGHKTSVSLEPVFWALLKTAAAREKIAINALVARIDEARLESRTPPGLASAIRVWLVAAAIDELECEPDEPLNEKAGEFSPAR